MLNKSAQKQLKAIKGMKDLCDEDAFLYEKIIQTCSKIAQNYGYDFTTFPHLESTPLFRRSVGESSDIVGKEMYEFLDKGGDSVCLRPEGTAGAVRAFIEKKLDKAGVKKRWFYHGSMFRYERPQRGRLREFHQFGVECFNEPSVFEDAAVILMLCDIFKALNVKFSLKINSLGDENTLKNYKKAIIDFCDSKNLCDDCKRRLNLNAIRVLDCKNENCQKTLENAPILSDFWDEQSKLDFKTLQEILEQNGVRFEVDFSLVRGLDYYCKSAFEFLSDEIGAKSAIAGGGRYDRLVEYLGGEKSYGVGFAMGVERIMEILKNQNLTKEQNGVYACVLDEKYLKNMFYLTQKLRAKNQKIIMNYDAKKLAKHLKEANSLGVKYFIAIGENEAQNDEILIKNLLNGEQKTIKTIEILQNFKDFNELWN